ncbi:uncharacterized protein LOC124169036 isoform X2 [Ischnura elegans]|nr:uncharacterized protein LOC124169036 isoform X2 [Ischnura elegans]
MHLLQFVNYFASIIYATFLKGMPVGSPEGYDHLFGSRHEEDYESGSDPLNEAMKCASRVEPVRTSLSSNIKAEAGVVGESFQGDLLYICKQSTERSLTPASPNRLLSNKEPLVKHKSYATYKTWMGQYYDKKFLLPSTYESNESTTEQALSSREGKQKRSTYNMLNFGKFLVKNSGKVMMLMLAIQLAAVQALHNTIQVDLVSEGNATDSFSTIPILAVNQPSFNLMTKNTSELAEIHQYVDIRKELLQTILQQTDTIINDLQEMANLLITSKDTKRPPEERFNLTTLPRVVRSLPLEESIMCEIEQETLINLRNELQAILEQPNARVYEGDSNNCQLNFASDRCEELIQLMQCGYSHLRDGFIAAGENMSEVILMGHKFTQFKENFMRLLDDKNKFHSQEYNQKINKLQTEVQQLQSLLNTSISLLKEKRIKYCISEISSGRIESAMQDFLSLADDSVLPEIITSVYSDYEIFNQIDKVVKFIEQLPSCVQHNITYTVLFDEMHKKDHLSSPNVLIVAQAARRCMGETFMKSYVERVLDTWANKVRTNKDDALIIDFGIKNWIAFRAYLPDLIDKAYENELSNVENIIFFVDKLYYLQDRAIGYLALFNKMRFNGHVKSYQTLTLANKVKECMHMYYYPRIEQHYRDMFITLRSYLPNSIKRLIWGNKTYCTIFNVHHGEYLNVNVKVTIPRLHCNQAGCHGTRSYSYEVYTERLEAMRRYLPSLSPSMPPGEIFHWELDTLEKGKYFRIKNKQYDMFLLSSEEKYNSEKHHIRIGTCGDCVDTRWRLEPEGDNFLIRSPRHDNYLYVDHENEYFRGHTVFGWSSRSVPDSTKMKMIWRIEC